MKFKESDGVYIKTRNVFGFVVDVSGEHCTVESAIDPEIYYEDVPFEELYWADEDPAHKDRCFIGHRWWDIKRDVADSEPIQTLQDLYEIIRDCWCKETAYPTCQEDWADVEEDPSYGQCAVTAMVVQDLFGGEIYRMQFETGATHYYNKIDGCFIDMGAEHYAYEGCPLDFTSGKVVDRSYFGLSEDTQKRYQLLSQRVAQRALTKNIRYTPKQFITALKDGQIENARFVFRGIHYELVDGWMLIWKKDGEDDEFIFDSDEEILTAPIFDGKTIVEISDQLTEIRVDLEPNWAM